MTITTCVFDAYGTLFDVAAAARQAAREPGRQAFADSWPKIAADWRAKQLQYTWLRAVMDQHTDFWTVTQTGWDWRWMRLDLAKTASCANACLRFTGNCRPFDEVPAMLADLKAAGMNTAILSNGSPDMLDGAVQSAGLGDVLDDTLSVESVGIFKPDVRVYDLVGARFGGDRSDVLFVSSNGWDAAAAAGYGFQTVWVNRAGEPQDRLPATPHHTMTDLTGIPALARAPMTQYFQTSDGLKLAYQDEGPRDALPVLALAGLTRNASDFDYVAPHLSHVRLIRMDYRGRGRSDWASDPMTYSIPIEAQDALQLLDHLGLARAAILGSSRGGLIAMVLAATAKDRLIGICLNDIGPDLMDEGLDVIRDYLGRRPKFATQQSLADAKPQLMTGFRNVPETRWQEEVARQTRQTLDGLDITYDPKLRDAVLATGEQPVPDLWPLFDAMQGLPLALIRAKIRTSCHMIQHVRW